MFSMKHLTLAVACLLLVLFTPGFINAQTEPDAAKTAVNEATPAPLLVRQREAEPQIQTAPTATVYFFHTRNAMFGRLARPYVYCDGVRIQLVKSREYFSIELPVGKHLLTLSPHMWGADAPLYVKNQVLVDLKPAKIYYFRATIHNSGYWVPSDLWTLDRVSEEEALHQMSGMKRTLTQPFTEPVVE